MREIPLTKGKVALVDDEFYDALVVMGSWCVANGYAGLWQRIDGHRSMSYMHRVILELASLPLGETVDHINGDKLNNQLCNLRSATQQQQQCNRGLTVRNTSGFKGVRWHRPTRKWVAEIRASGKYHYLGLFINKIEAAESYDNAARKYHGEFARLNFAVAA